MHMRMKYEVDSRGMRDEIAINTHSSIGRKEHSFSAKY